MNPPSLGLLLMNGCMAALAVSIALWLRPWRVFGTSGPPWLWLLVWAMLPLLWTLDRHAQAPFAQSLSGACLLVLLAGWPLAVLAFVPTALIAVLAGYVGWADGLHRLVWLGVVPGTLLLGIGAALRALLPHHLFVYIMGRAFLGTFVAATLAACAELVLHGAPGGLRFGDLVIARVLVGFGEATLTGMLASILVAFRPHWLATYSDRIYLPLRPGDQPPE